MELDPDLLRERIEARLKSLRMRREAASRKADLSRDYIRNIGSGKSAAPQIDNLLKLAEVLECTVAYLIGESDSPSSNLTEYERLALRILNRLDEKTVAVWLSSGNLYLSADQRVDLPFRQLA